MRPQLSGSPSPRSIGLALARCAEDCRYVEGSRDRFVEVLSSYSAALGLPVAANERIRSDKWLLTANHSRASTGTAIPGTPACDGTLSNTWQPLQSKVCKVDSSLNLNCMGRPQKGQRGRGASTSMRLVVRS